MFVMPVITPSPEVMAAPSTDTPKASGSGNDDIFGAVLSDAQAARNAEKAADAPEDVDNTPKKEEDSPKDNAEAGAVYYLCASPVIVNAETVEAEAGVELDTQTQIQDIVELGTSQRTEMPEEAAAGPQNGETGEIIGFKDELNAQMEQTRIPDGAPKAAESGASKEAVFTAASEEVVSAASEEAVSGASEEVVSVLEGNSKDTDVSSTATDAPVDAAKPEVSVETARTPQQDSESDNLSNTSGKDTKAAKTERKDGGPYPLENENDAEPVKSKEMSSKAEIKSSPAEEKTAAADTQTATLTGETLNIAPEKLAGEEKFSAEVQRSEPVTTEELFDKMVEKMELTTEEGSKTLEIQLRPDHLGKVSIALTMTESGLHARIQADDANVKGMIGGQISALIESLSEKGVKVAEVEVVYTGVSDKDAQGGHQSKDAPKENRQGNDRYAGRVTIKDTAYDAGMLDGTGGFYIDAAVSSVEYRA